MTLRGGFWGRVTAWCLPPALAFLLVPGCEEIEEVFDDPVPDAETIESGSFDRLWEAARVVLRKDFEITSEDRRRGRILARGRPAESYVNRGEQRRYPDMTQIVAEVRIDRKGRAYVLSVQATQETEAFGPDRFPRYRQRDRGYGGMTPALMRAPFVEESLLRQITQEVQGKR